jgi:hypothetical protein
MRRPREVDAGLLFPPRAAQGSSPAASTLERKQSRDPLYATGEQVTMQFRHNPSPWNASTKYRLVEGQSNELPALAAELVRHLVTVITASGVGCHRTCRKGSWMHACQR